MVAACYEHTKWGPHPNIKSGTALPISLGSGSVDTQAEHVQDKGIGGNHYFILI